MTFTEQDANNDGLIKREVGREMDKVAKTQNPEVYEHFVNVCEEVGREPKDVFGEMAVRALNSEEYAEQIFNSEISMEQLRADEIRLEDVQYVKQLTDELGIGQEEESEDPIDQLINERLQSITRSPIPRLNQDNGTGGGSNEQVAQSMEHIANRIEQLEEKIEGDSDDGQQNQTQQQQSDKGIDDLFGGGDEQPDEPVAVGDEGEQTQEVAEEPVPEEGPTEQEIEEAMAGFGEDDEPEPEQEDDTAELFTSDSAEVEVDDSDYSEETEETEE